MSDAFRSLQWLFGFRRVEARSVLPMETITLSLRAFANARFETEARDRVYQASGWAKEGKAAVMIGRKGWWPFTSVVNIRFKPQTDGPSVVFSEGLLFNSWVKLALFSAAVLFLMATGMDEITGQVRFGILFGIGFFVVNRWVGRKDWDILVEQFMSRAAALRVEEWGRDAAPAAAPAYSPQPAPTVATAYTPRAASMPNSAPPSFGKPIVQSGGGGIFGRRSA